MPTIEERMAAEPALADAIENVREAWTSMRMIREALEQFGPVREAEEPDFAEEARVLIEAIWRLASKK